MMSGPYFPAHFVPRLERQYFQTQRNELPCQLPTEAERISSNIQGKIQELQMEKVKVRYRTRSLSKDIPCLRPQNNTKAIVALALDSNGMNPKGKHITLMHCWERQLKLLGVVSIQGSTSSGFRQCIVLLYLKFFPKCCMC